MSDVKMVKNILIKHIKYKNSEMCSLELGLENININLKLITKNTSFPFKLEEVSKSSESIVYIWTNERFGAVTQEWICKSTFEDMDIKFEFKMTLQPLNDIGESILIQEYSFSPNKEPYFMIPGMLYGTNNIKDSRGNQPQLNYRGSIKYPQSPVIRTRADRSTHNAVLTVFNNTVLGVRIDEVTEQHQNWFYNGIGLDTRDFDEKDKLILTIGYNHFPAQYIGKVPGAQYNEEPKNGWISFKAGQIYRTKGNVFVGKAENLFAYERVISWFYTQIHVHPSNNLDRRNAIRDITNALITDGYDKGNKYFYINQEVRCGDTSWTGGMQVAYPLLCSSLHVPEARETALEYICNLVENGVNQTSGFLHETKFGTEWTSPGWWKDCITLYDKNLNKVINYHCSYVNGQAICYILKSYSLIKSNNLQVENLGSWLEVCSGIINKVIQMQRYDGALGSFFDAIDGSVLSYAGFQGAWFLAAITEITLINVEDRYIEVCKKAEEYYYGFLAKLEIWGMPIDAKDAVDEEGNLAYITALKNLHQLTGEEQYLKKLIHSLHYEFSWKFAYNTKHVNEPLKSLNWSSSGGSITSSHNVHIHQMGNLIVEEMYYAYRQTHDPYILSRLKDTLNWGLGTYNIEDNYFGYGKKGWATEQFYHTDGKQDDINRKDDGGIWYDYLSWAAACVLLSSSVDIPDELYIP